MAKPTTHSRAKQNIPSKRELEEFWLERKDNVVVSTYTLIVVLIITVSLATLLAYFLNAL